MNTKEELKKEILQAVKKGDIAKLYLLEQKANDTFDEQTLLDYYKNILDLSLEKLTDTLESHTKLDIKENVQDFATARALYEYAMEHYHAGKNEDAAALFEILSGITNDEKFSNAMHIHAAAAKKGIDLDTFLEEYADMDKVQSSGNFYIEEFTKAAHSLLEQKQKES